MDASVDKKASDVVLLDLRKVALIADYFVLCSGQSDRQLRAIGEGVIQHLKEMGIRPLAVEGESDSGWVLVDFGAVVLHVFAEEVRAYYDLESLWKEAPVVVHVQ